MERDGVIEGVTNMMGVRPISATSSNKFVSIPFRNNNFDGERNKVRCVALERIDASRSTVPRGN